MNKPHFLSWKDVVIRARYVADSITSIFPAHRYLKAYGIPRGGIYASLAVSQFTPVQQTDNPAEADVFIDDIIDSGKTRDFYKSMFKKPFLALVDKTDDRTPDAGWYRFPWEVANGETLGAEENVRRILQYVGEDPGREGLKDTPKRVIKAWVEMLSGYKQNPADVMTVFEEGACDELVLLKDLEFVSFCEHHMLPFRGHAAIGYIPNGKVIGISKLARMFEIYASRLQIQERLCQQVTQALDEHLQPKGSACVIAASHLCMSCRGVKKQNSIMITSSLTGLFKTDHAARSEFMQFVRSK